MRRTALLTGVALALVAGIVAVVMLLPYLQPSAIKFVDLFSNTIFSGGINP